MYAMIGVELRTHGEFSSNREDGSVKMHLHTSPIVVNISTVFVVEHLEESVCQ